MKKYDAIFFDADETLLDFKKSEEISFEVVLRKHNIEGDFHHYRTNYKKINDILWSQEALGLITKDFLKVERFRKFLEEHSLEANPEQICEDYLQTLPEHVYLLDGAIELITNLHKKMPMAIVTNGIGHVQHKRFSKANITHFFDHVVVSEECGFSKPDQRIFDLTLKKMGLSKASRILMVGDKLETDILGANRFGIDSCWFNPHNSTNDTDIKPTFEIKNLAQIIDLIFT